MIWGYAITMLLVALLLLLFPLWLRKQEQTLDSNAANVAVLKEQLAELESEYASGGMDQDLYEAAKEDLENSVAADLEESSTHTGQTLSKGWRSLTSLIVVIAVPIASVLLYQQLTTFEELPEAHATVSTAEQSTGASDGQMIPSIDQMVEKLAARLRENPDDGEGWFMLGKSYSVLDRHHEAVKAYAKAYSLVGDTNPQLMVDYAEALSSVNANSMKGKPDELLKKALVLDPDNQKGIWLAGFSAFEQEDFEGAAAHWQKLMGNPELTPETRQMLSQYITEARQRAGLPIAEAVSAPIDKPAAVAIQVNVSLDDGVAEKAGSDDAVFVFARMAAGMPMPLAVAKLKVSDLPTSVRLDESMAMMPGHSLADKDQVVIGARVSKAGTPTPVSGDLQGLTSTIDPKATSEISVVINQLVQ